uniref:Peptidase U35, phage prohead n=1 Tax=uncultured organism TaxID=155900 RepID=M1PVD8_9ZZZZ|nr:peptidase U35, phage prohead [uncultured organism]
MRNNLIKKHDLEQLNNPVKASKVISFMENTGADMRLDRFRESIGVDDFDSLLTANMEASLNVGYDTWEVPWKQLITVEEEPDMLENYVYNVGALGKIDKLEDTGGTFQEFDSPDDLEVSYDVDGFGNILVADFKTLKSDRLGWFGKISKEAGKAAKKRFFHWLFIDKLQDNPTYEDGNSLFSSSSHDNDISTGSGVDLTMTNLKSAWENLTGQTDDKGDPIYVRGAYLVVGEENEIAANVLTESEENPDTANNEKNFFFDKLEVVVVPWLGSDWYLWADRDTIETMEAGFLDGNVEPSVYMLNPEVSDTYFKTKKQMWRVEHYYGGEWIDYRGVVRGSQNV